MELLRLEKAFKATKSNCPPIELCPQGPHPHHFGHLQGCALPSCPGQPVGLGQPFP